MRTDWNPLLRPEFDKPYWKELQQFVAAERQRAQVFPGPSEVFAALHLTPYAATRVLILGQDPYHGPKQAHGLCFSVREGLQMTVRAHQAGSHAGKGWETFTDEVIRTVSAKDERVVFVLWGSYARKKKALIDTARHTVIESAHPSPLSAHNGFFGSRPFSRTNDALVAAGLPPIDWAIPE